MKNRKIMILVFLSLLIFGVNPHLHADVEGRRTELIKVLDEELKEVVRLLKQTGGARPDLMLRMGQVLLEKGRLLKDQENQKLLEIPAEKRSNVNVVEHFKESRKYFDQAQKTVEIIVKKHPKFEERGDAFYILAYNAKELKQESEAKKYFQKAIEESRPDTLINSKAKIALAEMYFNNGSYDKSMAYYESALKDKKDKWWTKDAFNLSWCYFKLGKHDKAIQLMNESYEVSKNPKFIDMSKSIERDMAFFYTESGRSNDAVLFYKKNGKNVSEVLFKVGRYLKTQGKFAVAEKTLTDALALNPNEKERIDINLELLSLYEKFGKMDKHLESCQLISQYVEKDALNADQLEVLKYNSQKMGALYQQQLVDKTFDHRPEVRNKKASDAAAYFSIMAKADPKTADESLFHAGETFFAIGNYEAAIPYYVDAAQKAKLNNNKKIEQGANSALLVSLGKGVKKETTDKYLIPSYEGYLSNNPTGDKSGVIYQRLFSSYYDKKNMEAAEKVLIDYRGKLPRDSEAQEKMIAKMMDFYKDKGDKAQLSKWANKIESKEYNVSPEYASKVHDLLLSMQFEKVEEANAKGDKKSALKGYFQIYKAKESTHEAKKMAAYNIAVLFFELGDTKQMHDWSLKALEMMSPKDALQFEKDLMVISTDLFQRRHFLESAEVSGKTLEKLCVTDSKNKKVFFKNTNIIYLTEKKFAESNTLIQNAKKCSISTEVINAGYVDYLNELAMSNEWTLFTNITSQLESNKEASPYLIYPLSLLTAELDNLGKSEEAQKYKNKMLGFYDSAKKDKKEIPFEALDAIAAIKMLSMEKEYDALKAIKLKFPEKDYNKILKSKFSKLEALTGMAEDIGDIGSGIGMLHAYQLLIEAHQLVKNEVSQFTPPGKSDEYVKSFKKGMQNLINPLDRQCVEFRNLANKRIEKESILSSNNSWFLSEKNYGGIYLNLEGAVLVNKENLK